MEIKEYLNSCLKKYYSNILKENNFELVKSNFGMMAGIYYFKSNWLNFEILNDRGIIETRISSIHSDKLYDFDIINAYFSQIHDNDKIDFLNRLNLEQESKLFSSNIELIKTIFNSQNYKKTESDLYKIQKERARILFG